MDNDYSEKSLVENPALFLLEEELGWKTRDAKEVSRKNQKSPLLLDDLCEALKNLNPWITNQQIDEVVKKLEDNQFIEFSLLNNRSKYYLIRDGIDVTVVEKGVNKKRRAILIDFDNPENNLFVAVSQLPIENFGIKQLFKPDLLGFVNGIPLLFVEFKASNIDIREAYDNNYKTYLDKIPQLFVYNAFCVFSNGNNTKIGAVKSKFEFFNDWKRLKEEDAGDTKIETFLRGACRKVVFLDLFENFILFLEIGGRLSKIVARNHQFLGVNKAIKRYENRKEHKGKLGTFWHTQGSGKSYSMIFYAEKIKRKFGGAPIFVILTDRKELDKQIYETFIASGVLGEDKNCVVENKKDLEQKIKEKHSYVFSLIHKFGGLDSLPIESDREIIIIVDEAHRTQYGTLAEEMYRFLPSASRIGFTGTPLLHDEEKTVRYFGNYVSQYDFFKAIEDKVTLPLHYQNRACIYQNINNPQINKDIFVLLEKENLTEEEKIKFQKWMTQSKHFWMTEDRLRKNAQDFVSYYSPKLEMGKALYVCLNRTACVLMLNFVKEYWAKEIENLYGALIGQTDFQKESIEKRIEMMKNTEMEIVVSDEDFDEEEIFSYGESIEIPQRTITNKSPEERFKKKDSNLRIVFVCAMWLTGFDVKCLSFLFLDKLLKAHTLMQAIARPNRVDDGKKYGVIVDYMNCCLYLKEALNKWTKQPLFKYKSSEEIIQKIIFFIDEIEKLLREQNILLNELIYEENGTKRRNLISGIKEKLLPKDTNKNKFNYLYSNLMHEVKYVDNEISAEIWQKINGIKAIYKELNAKSKIKFLDKEDLTLKCKGIIQSYIVVNPNEENYSILIEGGDLKLISDYIVNSDRKRSIVNDIRENLEPIFKKIVELNPTIFNLFNEYNRIIDAWNNSIDHETMKRIFEELMEVIEQFEEERHKHKKQGWPNIQCQALYDICKENDSSIVLDNFKNGKDFFPELFSLFKKNVEDAHNPFEKESTKHAIFADLREYIFSNYYRVLVLTEANNLTNLLFDYLLYIYQKDLLY